MFKKKMKFIKRNKNNTKLKLPLTVTLKTSQNKTNN